MLATSCAVFAYAHESTAAEFDNDILPQLAPLEDWQLVVDSRPAQDSLTPEQIPATATIDESILDDATVPRFAAPNEEQLSDEPLFMDEYGGDSWRWRWLPEGLIYHSYWAGVHEPRMALVSFWETSDGRALWDATLGGRVGLLQYGNGNPYSPEGFQVDFFGAAIARLDTENEQDLDSTDYVFGLPLTWGNERLQYKCGYSHISSHLGDEFAISHPGSLSRRINYVRDAIEFGTSYYIVPGWRTYGEIDFAFHRSGGAKPVDLEFGTELSKPGPTNGHFTPFAALNGRLRQEDGFGGDLAMQAGWLRRNMLDQTLRLGLHYYNGKSSQSQFFRSYEEQIGLGIWYDF
jgi:hypothetical protein